MSMDRCDFCDRPIDTDKDTECYFDDMCACEICRERGQMEAERQQDQMESEERA